MGRIIKRYENRKLYDSEERRYVSLEELAKLVREGVEIQVIDKSSEADITAQTLTQVILEEGKRGRNPLSPETLHDVIRWGNSVLDDGIQQVKERLDHIVPKSIEKIFHPGKSEEISELKKRIESLEGLINRLAQTQQDNGDSDAKQG